MSTDFKQFPWNSDAVLITPRHAVRNQWNIAKTKAYCQQTQQQLFICPAYDSINGRCLSLSERFAVASKNVAGGKRSERTNLELCIGMKVMVTFNVETDLDIANGARREIIEIVFDERESTLSIPQSTVRLEYPPVFVLIKMLSMKMMQLEGLSKNVVPLMPLERTFTIIEGTIGVENGHQIAIDDDGCLCTVQRLQISRSDNKPRDNRYRHSTNGNTYTVQHTCYSVTLSRAGKHLTASRL